VIRRLPVSPGVKQNLYLACYRVDSTEVRAFVQIAAMASKRGIFDIVAAAVPTGDNVFDLMRHRAMLLAKLAVLATIPGRWALSRRIEIKSAALIRASYSDRSSAPVHRFGTPPDAEQIPRRDRGSKAPEDRRVR